MFLVAGVTGHVGQVVARTLLGWGKKTRVLVRSEDKGARWAKDGAEVAVGSLDDGASLERALRGVAGAFLLLPPNFATKDFYGWQRATGATIAGAVKAAKVPHVTLLSSIGADIPEKNGPIKGLYHLERALRDGGTRLVALRPGMFMENQAANVGAARAAGIFPNFMPSADIPMPMIATKDIGILAASSLTVQSAKPEVVDLHGPAYTSKELAQKIGAAVGKTLQIVDIPPAGRVAALTQAGIPQQAAEAYSEMYDGFQEGIIKPVGDRFLQGTTTLDEVLPTLL